MVSQGQLSFSPLEVVVWEVVEKCLAWKASALWFSYF